MIVNLNYQGATTTVECATVAVEHCKGDYFNSFLIFRPDSEYACSMDGLRKLMGLYGILNIVIENNI